MLLILAALAASAFPTAVTLKTADGVTLHATYGAPSKATRGVVFVHMAGRNKEDWRVLAEKFVRVGDQVLTVDLRGHGANPPGAGLQPGDWPAMVNDVQAAVDLLQARGCTSIAIVGAEVGANLALNVAAEDPAVKELVLLSPGLDYKGVVSIDAARRLGDRPVLIVASTDDPYGARSATVLDGATTGPTDVKLYERAGKGTGMLNREPTLEAFVLGWVSEHWGALAPVPTPGAPPPAIEVDKGKIETSGPTAPDAPR